MPSEPSTLEIILLALSVTIGSTILVALSFLALKWVAGKLTKQRKRNF